MADNLEILEGGKQAGTGESAPWGSLGQWIPGAEAQWDVALESTQFGDGTKTWRWDCRNREHAPVVYLDHPTYSEPGSVVSAA